MLLVQPSQPAHLPRARRTRTSMDLAAAPAPCPAPIEPARLARALREADNVLVVDVRDPKAFAVARIIGSVSFTLPKILVRRYKTQQQPKLDDVLLANKTEFGRRHAGALTVVVTDTGSTTDDMSQLLLRCLHAEGVRALILAGGFINFEASFPCMCASDAPAPLMVLPSALPVCESDNPFDAPPSDILPHLVMSGERHAHDPSFICSRKITHVLNLTGV